MELSEDIKIELQEARIRDQNYRLEFVSCLAFLDLLEKEQAKPTEKRYQVAKKFVNGMVEEYKDFLLSTNSGVSAAIIGMLNHVIHQNFGPNYKGVLELTELRDNPASKEMAELELARAAQVATVYMQEFVVKYKLKYREDEQAATKAFVNMNKPAPEGTVKELAAKYGKSLSEIRKLKAEGRLHELTNLATI